MAEVCKCFCAFEVSYYDEYIKKESLTRRIARKGERGFTLMEILVALAIVGIIVAVTAAALGGRATTARLEAVATQGRIGHSGPVRISSSMICAEPTS